MATVRYRGGSLDGVSFEAPPEFADHPQREIACADHDRPFELYVRTDAADDEGAVLFELEDSSPTRVLTDEQEWPTDGS